MMDQFIEMFSDVMANRVVALIVMLSAAVGGIIAIAGGYYATFALITFLSNS